MNTALTQSHGLLAGLTGSTEGSFIENAADEAVWLTDHIQAAFRTEFIWECRKKGYSDGAGLNITVFNAVKDHESASLLKAMKLIFTPGLTEALRDRFGDPASSFYLQVERRTREILDARKPKKKKTEKPGPPIPPEPPSERMLRKMQRDKDLLDAQRPLLQDAEPDMTFERASLPPPLLTAIEAIRLGARYQADAEHAARRMAEVEKEFLGPPEPKTAQFSFTRRMREDRGEKVFRYSRSKAPRARRKRTAQT